VRDFETGLTAFEVRRLFKYVKSNGRFVRRVPVLGGRGGIQDPVGSVAGSTHKDGYVYIGIKGRLYLAHRLAVLWVNGRWPREEVDNRNGVRDDNRWCNLREATVSQNRQNTLGQKARVGLYPGVYRVNKSSTELYAAQIKFQGVVRHLGSFSIPEAARKARIRAERELFKEFAGSMR
jgi:hypothetical protein